MIDTTVVIVPFNDSTFWMNVYCVFSIEKVSKKHREKSLKQNIRAGESLFSQLEISCMEASNSNNSASETIGR